jgi:hypothetical protein
MFIIYFWLSAGPRGASSIAHHSGIMGLNDDPLATPIVLSLESLLKLHETSEDIQ